MGEYEPITKELREYASVAWEPWAAARERLLRMCDNIDAIHRSLEAENERLRDASERGDDWIKLPVDADGVPIHIGDVMGHQGLLNVRYTVVGISKDMFFTRDASGLLYEHTAVLYFHYKPDTWESIIEDAIGLGGDGCYSNIDTDRLIVRCKALCERTREGEE